MWHRLKFINCYYTFDFIVISFVSDLLKPCWRILKMRPYKTQNPLSTFPNNFIRSLRQYVINILEELIHPHHFALTCFWPHIKNLKRKWHAYIQMEYRKHPAGKSIRSKLHNLVRIQLYFKQNSFFLFPNEFLTYIHMFNIR